MGPARRNPWLAWAAIMAPTFATALTWPLTASLPFVNRVAVAVAAGLAIFAVIYLAAKAGRRGD
ncbi:MAG TPA: hypothetical protein VKA43_04130 [Gammaproteobacteria bacterium]|nr:hypothetical protein [Gammaproteobacteria bacterium]